MAEDVFNVEILPDGTIKSSAEMTISPANHDNAAKFLRRMGELSGGGEGERKKLKQGHIHAGGQHQHEGA
jgi:hypothetical protein